jgi:hypothetical protein
MGASQYGCPLTSEGQSLPERCYNQANWGDAPRGKGLFMALSRHLFERLSTSAFGGKTDIPDPLANVR